MVYPPPYDPTAWQILQGGQWRYVTEPIVPYGQGMLIRGPSVLVVQGLRYTLGDLWYNVTGGHLETFTIPVPF